MDLFNEDSGRFPALIDLEKEDECRPCVTTTEQPNVVPFPGTVSAVRTVKPDAPSASIQGFTRACRDARAARRAIGASTGTAPAGSKSAAPAVSAPAIGSLIGKAATAHEVRVSVFRRLLDWAKQLP